MISNFITSYISSINRAKLVGSSDSYILTTINRSTTSNCTR
nr:MAG TPA: hypothetical protein [Caudoviricetes sp.]